MRRGIISVLLLCLLLVGPTACNVFNGDTGDSEQRVVVSRGDLLFTVNGSGTIEVSNDRKLAFAGAGRIDKIYVDEGDKVSKDDPLAKLDTSALELALTQAEVARDEVEYNLNQLKYVLYASADRIELVEAQLEAAKQAITEAQKQIDLATITAPFDGVIASVDADEGDNASPQTPVIHIIDLTTMELKAEVDEIDIPGVKPGQRAIIDIDALPDAQLEGKVVSISILSVEEAGVVLYEVTINFDVPEGVELKKGMSADADIVTNERNNVLLLPSRAITKDSQGNTVDVLVNDQIETRRVVIGISDGLDTEIVDGLKEGEVVVLGK